MHRTISVWIRWGDYVLGVHDVRRGESLYVGSPPRQLLRFAGAVPRLCLPEERALEDGESIQLELDGLQYSIACTAFSSSGFEQRVSGGWLALLGTLALGAALAVRLTTPTPPLPHSVAEAKAPAASENHPPIVETTPEHAPVFALSPLPEPTLVRLDGDFRCGDADMGALVAEIQPMRNGVAGPRDNADPHLARPSHDVGQPAYTRRDAELGVPQLLPGNNAPTAPWARDFPLGTDEQSARGHVWGEVMLDAAGDDGLGLQRTAGGLAKRVEVAAVATNAAPSLRVVHTGLRVTGARKLSEVGRDMAAHFNDFRQCAEASAPSEARTVLLDFDVATDGTALASTAPASQLEACLGQSLSRVSFTPGASAAAHVVYPLHLVPVTSGLSAPHVLGKQPLAPAACDCG